MKNKKVLSFANCDVSAFEELVGYTIEEITTGEDDLMNEEFSITAYQEIDGVKIYREFLRENGTYYISEKYIPNSERIRIAKDMKNDL